MTMQASAYGRLGGDPREIATSTGNPMVVCSLAVDVARGESSDAPPLWLNLIAFGRVAEALAKHNRGDLISVSGRVQINRWRDKSGAEREQFQLVVDTVISARTVRPGGRRKASRAEDAPAPFDDELPA
jgi:single-strand DNA-binding protein